MVFTMTESEKQILLTEAAFAQIGAENSTDDLRESLSDARRFRPAMRSGPSTADDRFNGVPLFNPNQLQRTLMATVGARPGRAGDPTRQSEGPATGCALPCPPAQRPSKAPCVFVATFCKVRTRGSRL